MRILVGSDFAPFHPECAVEAKYSWIVAGPLEERVEVEVGEHSVVLEIAVEVQKVLPYLS